MSEPVLWHIPISHYSEKVRWALEYKGIEYRARLAPGGAALGTALVLTRGKSVTFPILELDGRRYTDSTDIVAALEERWPSPPLYPADAEERRRALELEEWFDEQVGPHVRLLGWHEALGDREALQRLTAATTPARGRMLKPAAVVAGGYVRMRYGVHDPDRAAAAREKVVAGLDKLEAELGDGEFLVGGTFTVADLTAAALLYPLVRPPEGPPLPPNAAFDEFRSPLAERRGFRWVEETFRRHRQPAATAVR
jgi:glutathione S-transferase